MIIGIYLLAIVLANVSVALFGPNISILNAFLFIGFNITTRDRLHQRWYGKNLKPRMGVLILTGALLSTLFGAGRIAIASFVAFMVSEAMDTLVYQLLFSKSYMIKVNGSNLVAASFDSLIFPILAFGFPVLWSIVVGQFLAKVLGGLLWAIIFSKVRNTFLDNQTKIVD